MQCSRPQLFDHLVGAGEQRGGYIGAERLAVFRLITSSYRRLHRQGGGLRPSQDAIDVGGGAPKLLGKLGRTRSNRLTVMQVLRIAGRQRVTSRERDG